MLFKLGGLELVQGEDARRWLGKWVMNYGCSMWERERAIHLARTTYYNLHTVFRDLSLGTLQSPRSCAHLCLLSQKMEIIRLKISEYILEVIWHPQTWSSTNLVLHYNIKVTKYFPSSLLVKMVCEYPTNFWNSMVESIQKIWLISLENRFL